MLTPNFKFLQNLSINKFEIKNIKIKTIVQLKPDYLYNSNSKCFS